MSQESRLVHIVDDVPELDDAPALTMVVVLDGFLDAGNAAVRASQHLVDLDGAASPYGPWLCADEPRYDPAAVARFFADNGFSVRHVTTRWEFARREDLESVLRIEFSAEVAQRAIDEVPGLSFPVGYRLHVRRNPTGLVLP